MARNRSALVSPAAAAAFAACCGLPHAAAQSGSATLPPVTVTSRAESALAIGGWGDTPLARLPLPASVYDEAALKTYDIQRLSDLTRLDPAVNDAYNAVGYWDTITLRGFVIDNRFNYRRDGLPINAETSVPLDNKQRIEVLKGVTGMQAGTSAPGGIVNFVVKRPTEDALRSGFLQWQTQGSVRAAADLSQRFGEDRAFGLRANAAYESLRPDINDADGHRWLAALAGDWRLAPGTLLEAEFESSQRSQASVPAFSLLGDRLPTSADPGLNLNRQPWSQPVVFGANTGSLRFSQAINEQWRWSAQAATQRLTTDDRMAFPFGCGSEGNYDRFCSDGSFDVYDFRSDNEQRRTDTAELALHAAFATGSVGHALSLGVLGTRFEANFERQAFNWVGSDSIDHPVTLPADPTPSFDTTNRSERSTEYFIRDALRLSDSLGLWLALRHTQISRRSVSTSGLEATDYSQSINSPWLAATWQLDPAQMLYASWGRGAESDVVPNRAAYVNAGQALPALMSEQFEIGWKGASGGATWSLAAFDITRPVYADAGSCFDPDTCTRQADGDARHTGIEAGAALRAGPWRLGGGLQWLKARRSGSQDPNVNGQRPVNVPALTFKAQLRYAVPQVPALEIGADVAAEGDRTMFPYDSAQRLPGFAIVGLNGQWAQRAGASTLTWRAGIDNLFDKQGWKESPTQFGHVYLFQIAGRSLRASVQLDW
ncbi:MAG: TonB-dependent siderophore receptor [Ideonella sp.]|nr:TonB-dependent siderophore receptor [Ideonella sp.]